MRAGGALTRFLRALGFVVVNSRARHGARWIKLELVPAGEWVMDFSPGSLRAIGSLEILAAGGLIRPAALDIAPVLLPVTAVCVAPLFTGAVTMRLRRSERATIAPDLVHLALAVFIAWGRFGPDPFVSWRTSRVAEVGRRASISVTEVPVTCVLGGGQPTGRRRPTRPRSGGVAPAKMSYPRISFGVSDEFCRHRTSDITTAHQQRRSRRLGLEGVT